MVASETFHIIKKKWIIKQYGNMFLWNVSFSYNSFNQIITFQDMASPNKRGNFCDLRNFLLFLINERSLKLNFDVGKNREKEGGTVQTFFTLLILSTFSMLFHCIFCLKLRKEKKKHRDEGFFSFDFLSFNFVFR